MQSSSSTERLSAVILRTFKYFKVLHAFDKMMNTPPSDHGDSGLRPIKKMRKGTKSCSECRRRKTRCIFKEDSPICDGCVSRGSRCVEQTYAEGIKSVDKQKNGQSESLPIGGITSTSSNTSYTITPCHDFENAPLLSLFDNAIISKKHDEQENAAEVIARPLSDKENQILCTMKSLIPTGSDLFLILQISQGNWELWRVLFSLNYGVIIERLEDGQIEKLRADINQALQSDNIFKIAKILLGLALIYQVCSFMMTISMFRFM